MAPPNHLRMRLLDLTLATPEENLALDEALLETAERSGQPWEVLRIWESPSPLVVVGRSSRIAEEVDQQACRELRIPVLRRCSGGGAVVAGPGCLMYALVLSRALRPELEAIDEAHRLVLEAHVEALGRAVPGELAVARRGISDLALGDRKFSGNSMRARREHVLYHGTLLYDFPLELIGRCLGPPPREPDYRRRREHLEFVTNLPVQASELPRALVEAWQADRPLGAWPEEITRRLAAEKYARREWNYQR